MSLLIDKLHNRHRQSVRRVQLDNFFKQKRKLLEEVSLDNVINVLNTSLEGVKAIMLDEPAGQDPICLLIQLQKITHNCDVIEVLCQFVTFTPEQTRSKQLPENLTWLDLLLLLLRDSRQFTTFYEVISAVIRDCVYQLKLKLAKQQNSSYFQQMRRVMESYPFEFLREDSAELVANTLDTISYISSSGRSSVFLYYLLNKTTPPLLKLLNQVSRKKELMQIESINERWIDTCITLASMVQRYNFDHLQPDRFDFMCNSLKEMARQYMGRSRSKEQFSRACLYLTLLSKLNLHTPNQEDCERLEGFLGREIGEENQSYFKLLSSYVYDTTHKLAPENFKKLVEYIFDSRHQQTNTKLRLRVVILKILKLHIINCGNHIREEDLKSFSWMWEVDAYPLIDLAQALNQQSHDDLKLLFQVLSFIIVQCSADILNESFFPLLHYRQYRIMLQQIGYTMIGEEDYDSDEGEVNYE